MLEYGLKFGPVLYLALKFTVCTVQCFLKRGSKEFWLASSFEGHGSSLRSLPHPSLYPRTPLIWFEQQNLFFNLRLAMIWHVFLFNFLHWLQNTQEAPCLCHSRPGWYETIRDRKSEFRSQLWKFWGQSGKTNMAFICPKMAQKCLYQGLYQTKFEQHHAKTHLSTSILVYLIRANSFCGLQTEVAVWGGEER